MKLREAIEDKHDFEFYMEDFFEEYKELNFGYGDEYDWEKWNVSLEKSKTVMIVDFTIGSLSGWVAENNHVESLSLEDFRQLLINKKFKDESIDVIYLIEEATENL